MSRRSTTPSCSTHSPPPSVPCPRRGLWSMRCSRHRRGGCPSFGKGSRFRGGPALTKIAFIGAGSVVFTKNLLTDVFKFPELRGATIALHDIDPERLETAGMMARWTSAQLGAGATVEEHLDRRAALDGADFVVNMVQIGMHEATLLDFEIPRKYGLKQTIADTLSIGGIFRGLRTIPFVLDLAAEMADLCPRALLLNYTNPMGILMEVEGDDAYPRLFVAMEDPDVYAEDKVCFELMRRLGYFVTESSEHNAEYVPYFLRDDELIERYDVPVDEYIR